jgi:hypothetical protein
MWDRSQAVSVDIVIFNTQPTSNMSTKLERAQRMIQWLQAKGGYVHPSAVLRDGKSSASQVKSRQVESSPSRVVICFRQPHLVPSLTDTQTPTPASPSLQLRRSAPMSASFRARSPRPLRPPSLPRPLPRPPVCPSRSSRGARGRCGTRGCWRPRILGCIGCGRIRAKRE